MKRPALSGGPSRQSTNQTIPSIFVPERTGVTSFFKSLPSSDFSFDSSGRIHLWLEHVRRFAFDDPEHMHDIYPYTCQCSTPSTDDHPPSQRKRVRRLIEVEDCDDTPERQHHSNHYQRIAKSFHPALLKHVRSLNRFDCWTEGLHTFLHYA